MIKNETNTYQANLFQNIQFNQRAQFIDDHDFESYNIQDEEDSDHDEAEKTFDENNINNANDSYGDDEKDETKLYYEKDIILNNEDIYSREDDTSFNHPHLEYLFMVERLALFH
ncbi:unnamed protein product [Rotaria magnacalcarata]|uniref:Uncharacterized protein n=1 Tax=Rotaria magnacalcarata TaxID=392030 RepID=A0A817AHQ8_9BILA|nr:unnamed protein product [Rotaria magnacalcarata]CAF3830697.1 unnamed protein product [Rotaria magnacalcarata]